MLNEIWRDLISLAGLALTLVALVYAIIQIRMTKTAARAAEEAAKKTLAESHLNFFKYIAATAHRFISEVKIHINDGKWEEAGGRLNDLADQIAQMSSLDPDWQRFAELLRQWACSCRRLALGELRRFEQQKWLRFCLELQTKIDALHGPFRDSPRSNSHDS